MEEEDDNKQRYASTKRNVLLDNKEIEKLNRERHSAPIEKFSSSFFNEGSTWGKRKESSISVFNTTAEEYVPSFDMSPPVYSIPAPTANYIMPGAITPDIALVAKDSSNSRLLQQRLQIADDVEKRLIFDSILPDAYF